MRAISFRLEPHQLEALERAAKEQGTTPSDLLRRLLDEAIAEGRLGGEPSILPALKSWWAVRLKQDPEVWEGFRLRAQGAGMDPDWKLFLGLRMLLDHGIL